jgi:hypothetical protein
MHDKILSCGCLSIRDPGEFEKKGICEVQMASLSHKSGSKSGRILNDTIESNIEADARAF